MAMVRDWFPDFLTALVERSGREDFPEPGSEFWEDFERSLARTGATWPEADEAASIACDLPDLFPNAARSKVLEAIKAIRSRAIEAKMGAAPGSLDAARIASKDCPDCEGTGFAARYVHDPIYLKVRTAGGSIVPVGGRVSCPCSCPLGKLSALGLMQPGMPRPPLTVDEYPSLRMGPVWYSDRPDNRFRHHPESWDEARGCPDYSEASVATGGPR